MSGKRTKNKYIQRGELFTNLNGLAVRCHRCGEVVPLDIELLRPLMKQMEDTGYVQE